MAKLKARIRLHLEVDSREQDVLVDALGGTFSGTTRDAIIRDDLLRQFQQIRTLEKEFHSSVAEINQPAKHEKQPLPWKTGDTVADVLRHSGKIE